MTAKRRLQQNLPMIDMIVKTFPQEATSGQNPVTKGTTSLAYCTTLAAKGISKGLKD